MHKMAVVLGIIIMAGCSSNIINGQSFPDGAAVYRCTEYDGSIAGTWTNTSAQVEGCQCMQLGAELSGTVEIQAGEQCKMTFTPGETN